MKKTASSILIFVCLNTASWSVGARHCAREGCRRRLALCSGDGEKAGTP